MGRMLEHARAKGGNAVIGMRFDTSEMGDVWTELCAYGTAVVAVPVDEGAKQTARAAGYGQPGGSPAHRADPVQSTAAAVRAAAARSRPPAAGSAAQGYRSRVRRRVPAAAGLPHSQGTRTG